MAAGSKEQNREFCASHRNARISARKARLVVDLIRGLSVERAIRNLDFCQKRAGPMVSKVLKSAMANATQLEGVEPETLYVRAARVDEGPTMKRWRPRAMGRAFPRLKRTCHINVSVAQMTEIELAKAARGAQKNGETGKPEVSENPPTGDVAEDSAEKTTAKKTSAKKTTAKKTSAKKKTDAKKTSAKKTSAKKSAKETSTRTPKDGPPAKE